jgi:hypothetical protein
MAIRSLARLRAAVVLVAALAAAAPLTACSDGRPSPADGALTAAQRRDLSVAEDLLVGRCMRALGFEYHHVTAGSALDEDRDFPYGIDDRDWAAKHGLGTDIRAAVEERTGAGNPNRAYIGGLDPARRQAYTVAMYGRSERVLSVTVPTGDVVSMSADGCLADAQADLYGDVTRWFPANAITNNVAGAVQPAVLTDARYKAVASDWAVCMAGRGHEFADPVDLRARFQGRSPDVERAVATAEADCVLRTGLADTGRRLDAELGAPVRAKYAADIRACHKFQVAALPRAAELIGTTPGTEASD